MNGMNYAAFFILRTLDIVVQGFDPKKLRINGIRDIKETKKEEKD